jgi:hypothetical protein
MSKISIVSTSSHRQAKFIDKYYKERKACPPLSLGKTQTYYGKAYGMQQSPREIGGSKPATSPVRRRSPPPVSSWERESAADLDVGGRGVRPAGVMVASGGFRTGPTAF